MEAAAHIVAAGFYFHHFAVFEYFAIGQSFGRIFAKIMCLNSAVETKCFCFVGEHKETFSGLDKMRFVVAKAFYPHFPIAHKFAVLICNNPHAYLSVHFGWNLYFIPINGAWIGISYQIPTAHHSSGIRNA